MIFSLIPVIPRHMGNIVHFHSFAIHKSGRPRSPDPAQTMVSME
jgi:hypothetical protein